MACHSMINSPKHNIRGLHTWWFDCTTTCVFATWAITTIKKSWYKIASCASLQHELINSLLKGIGDQMSKKRVSKCGFQKDRTWSIWTITIWTIVTSKGLTRTRMFERMCVVVFFLFCFHCWNLGCCKRQSCPNGNHLEREKKC